MVLFKFIDRCTEIVSTLILARLLLPEDFGLIALANTLIAMLEILGAFGLESAGSSVPMQPGMTRFSLDV